MHRWSIFASSDFNVFSIDIKESLIEVVRFCAASFFYLLFLQLNVEIAMLVIGIKVAIVIVSICENRC